ncbi:hypothetical protein [Gorillibacterium sp. sgz5001074]
MKRQAPVLHRKSKDSGVNKKALIWVSAIVAVIVIVMAVLLIVNG